MADSAQLRKAGQTTSHARNRQHLRRSGFPDAAERQAKLRLAYTLNQMLEKRKFSQADAAKVLGVTQPKVSALRHYKLGGLLGQTLDESANGTGPGCRDRDPTKAPLTEGRRISVVAA